MLDHIYRIGKDPPKIETYWEYCKRKLGIDQIIIFDFQVFIFGIIYLIIGCCAVSGLFQGYSIYFFDLFLELLFIIVCGVGSFVLFKCALIRLGE